MTDMSTIAATAMVIVNICKDEVDVRTKLERISYAAALIQRDAIVGLQQINPSPETNHG